MSWGQFTHRLGWQVLALLGGLVALVGLASSLQIRAGQSITQLTANATTVRQQLAAITDVLDVLQDAETGQRGFLLTARPHYLDPYNSATARIGSTLSALQEAARNAPWLQTEAAELARVAEQKLEELEQTIALTSAGNVQGALDILKTDRGKLLMDDARTRVSRIAVRLNNEEIAQATLLQERQARLGLATQVAVLVGLLVLGLALLSALVNRARLITTQEAERLVNERLAAGIDRLRDGVAIFDRTGMLILRNERLGPVLGVPPDQVMPGQSWDGLAAASGHVPMLANVQQGADPVEIITGTRTLELSRSAMPDGGHILAVADISRRVSAEEIARQAQKMDVLGQMTGGVAHDFNNLLQVISANLELVAMRLGRGNEPDSWVQARLEAARVGVTRGARLTRHLLAFARRQPLAPEAVDPGRLVIELEDMLRRTAGATIKLELLIDKGLWPVRADPNQIENALLNLMLNARDAIAASDKTTGHITIEVANAVLDDAYAARVRELTAGAFVMFAVTDDGTGMTPDQLTRATEPFFTTKLEGHGTGLGLSMVFGFAKQSGGHFQLSSEAGHGTTAKLFLPRTDAPAIAAPRETAPEGQQGRGETILLVEDDAAVRTAGAEVLRGLGYKVVAVHSPEAALATIKQGLQPHVMLTDVIMPGPITVRDLAARAAGLVPGLPVLFTSGYTQNSIVQNDTLDPGITLIGKPWPLDELARTLRHAIRPSPLDHAAPPARRVVLLVEDEMLIRLMTAGTLTDLGYAVIEAEDGATALARAPQADCVVLDLGLPDMPGLSVAAALRDSYPALPIIIASGQGPALDGYGWLPKPYDAEGLRAALERAVPA